MRFYHFTTLERLPSILIQGLRSDCRNEMGRHYDFEKKPIWLTNAPTRVWVEMGFRGIPVLLRVLRERPISYREWRIRKDLGVSDRDNGHEFVLEEDVPPEDLAVLKVFRRIPRVVFF